MADTVVMPRLGMTMLEGTVAKWLQADGARVKKGDLILEVETDKIVHQVEALRDGFLKQAAAEGEVVGIGRPLAYILAEGESPPPAVRPSHAPARAARSAPAAAAAGAGTSQPAGMRASPIARRMAAEAGIDLATVEGTGPGGRVVEADVKAAVQARAAKDGRAVKERIPLTGVRGATARHMQAAAAVPQVTLHRECAATALVEARERLLRREAELGVRVSYNAIIAKAFAQALLENPMLNSSLVDGTIHLYEDINVGVAVNSDRGLFVPVLRRADRRPLAELAAELEKLAARAREGALGPDDLSGGTATLTNLGGFGVDVFNPILNAPESAILGVGRIRAGQNGEARMWLSLTFDHRVADGALAARLLDRLTNLLEQADYLKSLA